MAAASQCSVAGLVCTMLQVKDVRHGRRVQESAAVCENAPACIVYGTFRRRQLQTLRHSYAKGDDDQIDFAAVDVTKQRRTRVHLLNLTATRASRPLGCLGVVHKFSIRPALYGVRACVCCSA